MNEQLKGGRRQAGAVRTTCMTCPVPRSKRTKNSKQGQRRVPPHIRPSPGRSPGRLPGSHAPGNWPWLQVTKISENVKTSSRFFWTNWKSERRMVSVVWETGSTGGIRQLAFPPRHPRDTFPLVAVMKCHFHSQNCQGYPELGKSGMGFLLTTYS